MTTGRINQIANVTSPTHAGRDRDLPVPLRGVRGETSEDAALQRVLYYSRLKSLAVRQKLAAKETVKRRHPRARGT